MIGAGELNRRVTIKARSESGGLVGEATVTFDDVAEVWAAVKPLSSRIISEFRQAKLEGMIEVSIRYRSDVTSEHIICWDGHLWNIANLVNWAGQNEYLTLTCTYRGRVDGN